ncbi:MAG: hypothetical protein LBQ73_01285 [Tannerellaceae bacterium]|jgi:hypothetical protein|nr:hypothetical protein [Tannerellaceae bacterium]
MRRFIKSAALFAVLFVLLYPILVLVWGFTGSRVLHSNLKYQMQADGHTHSRLAEVKTIENVDVLIIGSSHALRGVDTRVFRRHGVKAFNLGTNSQTPIQTKLLLKRYLDRLQPKLVIYDVYPYFFTTDGVESALNIIGCDTNDAHSMEMAQTIRNLKVYHTLFYGVFRDKFHLNDSYREPAVAGDDTYIPGGYVERKMAYYRPETQAKKEYDFKEQQFAVFDEIIRMFNERNIGYILVNAPVTRTLYDSYANWQAYEQMINSRGTYYDFNRLLNLNDSLHFYDDDHLNRDGVEIYSEKLIEIVGSIDYK